MRNWVLYVVLGVVSIVIILCVYDYKKGELKDRENKEFNRKALSLEKVCLKNNLIPLRYGTKIKSGTFYAVSIYFGDGFYTDNALHIRNIDTCVVIPDDFPVSAYENGDLVAVILSGEIGRKLEYSIGSTETYTKTYSLIYDGYYDLRINKFIYK